MKNLRYCFIFSVILGLTVSAGSQIPHLKNTGKTTQLIVHGKPLLMLAGEANNSSGSNIVHMEKIMKDLRESNLNSLLVSVSWEIVEPQEGVFDFTSIDELIRVARDDNPSYGIRAYQSNPSEPAILKFRVLVYDR